MKNLSIIFVILLTITSLPSKSEVSIDVGITRSNFDAASCCGCVYKSQEGKGLIFIPELRDDKYIAAMNLNGKEIVVFQESRSTHKCEEPNQSEWCSTEIYKNDEFKITIRKLSAKSSCGVSVECESDNIVSEFLIESAETSKEFITKGVCAC